MVLILIVWSNLFIIAPVHAQQESTTWIQHDTPALNISLPSSWVRLDNPQLIEQLTTASLEANQQYTETVGYFLLNPVEIYLADADLNATLNITTLQFDLNAPLVNVADAMIEFYAGVPGIEVINSDVVTLPAGNAVRLRVALPINTLDGEQLITEQVQYIVYAPDNTGYILSISLPSDTFDAYLPTVESIVATLTFNGFQSTWFGYSSPSLIVQAPTDWEIRAPQPENNIQLSLAHPTLNLSATYAVTPLDGIPDLDTLISDMTNDYEAQGGMILEVTEVSLASGDVIRIHGATMLDGVTVQQYIYVLLGESLITATFTAEESQFDSYALTFIHMMATVRLLG